VRPEQGLERREIFQLSDQPDEALDSIGRQHLSGEYLPVIGAGSAPGIDIRDKPAPAHDGRA